MPPPPQSLGEKRRILLIEDDRLQQRVTQEYFKQFRGEQFELEGAITYEDGLEKLLTGRFAACILDYQLGPRDGLTLIREARAEGCTAPIIFLTAETDAAIDRAALDAGALDYLVKGEITPAALERSLRYSMKMGETLAVLRELATRDSLTGLLNRRETARIIEEECERSRRFSQPFSLVVLDLDHFKAINDTHGHPAGDAVLQEVARRIASGVRSVDRVGRLGGEEFAVILVLMHEEDALQTSERLCRAIADTPILLPGGTAIPITISAGIATASDENADAAGLFSAADKALYAAKTGGRNRTMTYSRLTKAV